MKKELNISEILKYKLKSTSLYSPIFGKCVFSFIQGVTDAICVIANDNREFFDYKGLYFPTGECLLFPSKEMRNWSKFKWKKGDILVSNDGGTEVIFDKWYDDTYTSFYSKHYLNSEDENNIKYNEAFLCSTERYSLESENAAQTYINTIEERLGGKLNRETLEIEPAQPEFKDGDILLYKSAKFTFFSSIFILDTNRNGMRSYVRFSIGKGSIDYDVPVYNLNTDRFRYATEEEKQQLFSALAKEGKAWDSEKKEVVDLKPKVELKPFDKVLVRDFKNQAWTISIFGFKDAGLYFCCNGTSYQQCIPYKGNESLLGETKDVEG